MRTASSMYPDYSFEIGQIESGGISAQLMSRIIKKHTANAAHSRNLYDRYQALDNAVPIFSRQPRFEDTQSTINNKVNNDFFSEIIDIKVGYFSGKPISYCYSQTEESQEDTGGSQGAEIASKALSDFVTRNNMYDIDMEITKFASTCGYAARLFYVDEEGDERAIAVPPMEAILLYKDEMTRPIYSVRYFEVEDEGGQKEVRAEFYDNSNIYYFKGKDGEFSQDEKGSIPHMFDYSPLQGIPNNRELMGDAEKVIELIDAYDRAISDESNEIESFSNAYMVFKGFDLKDEDMARAQASGAISFTEPDGDLYYLTKEINDTFNENYLNRIESNIYRFSKTPNMSGLSGESFGAASGVSLKFKITGLESKCGMFQSKMQSAGAYMFKLLASSLNKKRVPINSLQCYMEFKRNFPLDLLNEAQAVQALIGAGLPKRIAFTSLSGIDDVDYVMDLINEEQDGIPSLLEADSPEKTVEEDGNK